MEAAIIYLKLKWKTSSERAIRKTLDSIHVSSEQVVYILTVIYRSKDATQSYRKMPDAKNDNGCLIRARMEDCVVVCLCVQGVSVCPTNKRAIQILVHVIVNYINTAIMLHGDS